MKKKNSLNITLIKSKPYKVYEIKVQYDSQIKELCNFIRNNKDKEVGIVINGKHTKFNSLADKKRFTTGFDQGSNFVLKYTKELFKEMQGRADKLSSELAQAKNDLKKQKDDVLDCIGKLRTKEIVTKLRQDAYDDSIGELKEDRDILKDRLNKVEPVIDLVIKATTGGQLQNAYKVAKKLKLG